MFSGVMSSTGHSFISSVLDNVSRSKFILLECNGGVVSGLNVDQDWSSHVSPGSWGYRPVVGTCGDPVTLTVLPLLCVCSGWSPGSHLGHPADASGHRGPHPGLHSRGRDQQCTVGIHPARLDSHLLQQLPGDPQGLTLQLLCPSPSPLK